MKKVCFLSVLTLGVLSVAVAASVALAAYSSHQNDQDVNHFLTVYPFAKSTKLDDCSLCHPGSLDRRTGSCDYCHTTYGPATAHINPVPLQFIRAGVQCSWQEPGGSQAIETFDSDGDGSGNLLGDPRTCLSGDNTDYPGLSFCSGDGAQSGADSSTARSHPISLA